jgi:hypothetical protein
MSPVVNDGKIQASLEFAEVWVINYPENRLSLRKRQEAWAWLNRQFFRVKDRKALYL